MLGVDTVYATRLRRYLNQTAQLERAGEPDRYGNASYSPPEPIQVRKENRARQVISTTGETVTSRATIYLATEVKPGDKIDGCLVLNTGDMVDKGGNIVGYEAYMGENMGRSV